MWLIGGPDLIVKLKACGAQDMGAWLDDTEMNLNRILK